MTHEELEKFIEKARQSNIAKSVRRIYFIGLEQPSDERGFWHTDIMSGMGSGVLIKYNENFFLLTAKHVFKSMLEAREVKGEFDNESPFWITAKFNKGWTALYDFLMPKRIWNIGELIHEEATVVTSDVCLVELFKPLPIPRQTPDYFIDIQDDTKFYKKDLYYEGKLLLISGYPYIKNSYNWDIEHPEFTHATTLVRQTYTGVFIENDDLGYISFEYSDGDKTNTNSKGVSGGIVYDVQEDNEETFFCGIISTVSNNKCYFIPSHVLFDAIVNYEKSSFIPVDPSANHEIVSN